MSLIRRPQIAQAIVRHIVDFYGMVCEKKHAATKTADP
jgi:hypothetical protein